MTYALINHTQCAGGPTGNTSPGVDTTGATLLIATTSCWVFTSLTDSKGNTWTPLTLQSGALPNVRIYYCPTPVVGASHTFTLSATYSTAQITAWSGSLATTPFDVENSGGAAAASVATGSVTPSVDNSLIVTAFGDNLGAAASINSSFTISDQEPWSNAVNFGGACAYLIQTTATAVNPTWTSVGANWSAATIATFKPSVTTASTLWLNYRRRMWFRRVS